MSEFVHLTSITEAVKLLGLPKPMHPLITVIRTWPESDFDFRNVKVTSGMYLLSMKGKLSGSSFQYGKNPYDFAEGTLVFLAPNQAISFEDPFEELDDSGWTIVFHPDLIRRSELGKSMKEYSFFDYDVHEALHISDKEKQILIGFVRHIEIELSQHIDKHSQELIITNLQSILKYCQRYYDRQFFTRTNLNQDYLVRFQKFLESYFSAENLMGKGLPTVSQCGEALNMSGSYLSDLLKLETGRSAKDHIHSYLIEKAKTLLLGSNASINEVAYDLGFEYPQHFSKLFKTKTGLNPTEYRSSN